MTLAIAIVALVLGLLTLMKFRAPLVDITRKSASTSARAAVAGLSPCASILKKGSTACKTGRGSGKGKVTLKTSTGIA